MPLKRKVVVRKVRAAPRKPTTDLSKIHEGIYQGGTLLDRPQVDAVIALTRNVDHPKRIGHLKAHLWVPIEDVPAAKPPVEWLDAIVDTLITWRHVFGWRVLVHCRVGGSRSAMVVIAYTMKAMQVSFKEAYAFVKDRRPMTHPNDGFVKSLLSYEEFLFPKAKEPEPEPEPVPAPMPESEPIAKQTRALARPGLSALMGEL